jgi:small subunit ribosomal protein S6
MAEYETICVLEPDVQGEKLTRFEDKIKKILSQFKIEKVAKQDWGLRKLAYPIRKFNTGHYFRFVFEGPGAVISELERNIGYEEFVLRTLTITIDKKNRSDAAPDTVSHFGPEPVEFRFGRDREDRPNYRDRGDRPDYRADKGGEGAAKADEAVTE